MAPGLPGRHTLGLDVGAVSVSGVQLASDGEVVRSWYTLHHGEPAETLGRLLADVDLTHVGATGATMSTPARFRIDGRYDNQVCLITAAERFHPDARSILVIGGERRELRAGDELVVTQAWGAGSGSDDN